MDSQKISETARLLNHVCKMRGDFDFYKELNEQHPKFYSYFNEVIKNYKPKQIVFERKLGLNIGQVQSVVLEFFEDFNKGIAKKIWNVLENTKITTLHPRQPSNTREVSRVEGNIMTQSWLRFGKVRVSSKLESVEVFLFPEDNVSAFTDVAHEFGHLLDAYIQKKTGHKDNNISEIVSFFCEKMCADWLLKNGWVNEDEYKKLQALYEQAYMSNVNTVFKEMALLKHFNFTSPITPEKLENFEKLYKGTRLQKIFNRQIEATIHEGLSGQDQYRYIVGYFASEILYRDFKRDPQTALKRFNKYLNTNNELNVKEACETLCGKNYVERFNKFGKSQLRNLVDREKK